MTPAFHVQFGRFTGDHDGIHLWDWYARRLGFRRARVRLQAERGEGETTFALFAGDERPGIVGRLRQAIPHGPPDSTERRVVQCTRSNRNCGPSTPTA